MRRFLVPGTVVLFLLLGASIGLAECAQLLRACISRSDEFKIVRPMSIEWIEGIRPLGHTLESLDAPFRAVSVAVLLLLIAAVAALLDPHFRLLKPPDENPGRGASAHLDLNRLFRGLPWVVVTLGWMGVLAPLSLVFPRPSNESAISFLLLGGLPVWTAFLPRILYPIVQAILTGALLWLIWSEGGLASAAPRRPRGRILLEGALAGAAMSPSFLLFREAPSWAMNASRAYGLGDEAAWYGLAWVTALGPTLAMVLLGGVLVLFRRRPDGAPAPRIAPVLAILGVLIAGGGTYPLVQSLNDMDAMRRSLGRHLGLPRYELNRFAYIVMPDGSVQTSIVPDGSANEDGWDRISCTSESIKAVEDFLALRKWRTQLRVRAWSHLHACASIDWLKSRNLDITMQLIEHAPTPVALQRLLDMLENCPTSAKYRKYLDRIADTNRFHWLTDEGKRWLGLAYLRFGDAEKARSLLMNSGLKPDEFRRMLTGVTPIADGKVTGKITVDGVPEVGMRLGLVRLEQVERLVALRPPHEWRAVVTSTYTGSDGSFTFDDIPEGRYALVMTGGPVGLRRGTPKVAPPADILVDRFHAVANLKTLDLYFDPTPVPPQEPPATPPPYAPRQERTEIL